MAGATTLERPEEGRGWTEGERALADRSRGLSLGSLAGIPIRVDSSWLLIFVLVAWAAASYFPRILPGVTLGVAIAMGVAASLMLFASIVVHELSHSLVARALGYEVQAITLFIFGGVSEIAGEPRSGRHEGAIAIVGPLSSLAIGASLEGATRALGTSPVTTALLHYLAVANVAIAVFNMLPGFPLDGGRVLRAVFRGLGADLLGATRSATRVGELLGVALMGLGVASFLMGGGIGGIWLGLVGWFLRGSAEGSYRQLVFRTRIEHLHASDGAARLAPLDPDDTVRTALLDRGLLAGSFSRYPVARGGQLLGMVATADLRAVPRGHWDIVPVAALEPRVAPTVLSDASLLEALDRMMRLRVSEIAVTDRSGAYVGLLRLEDVMRLARVETDERREPLGSPGVALGGGET